MKGKEESVKVMVRSFPVVMTELCSFTGGQYVGAVLSRQQEDCIHGAALQTQS